MSPFVNQTVPQHHLLPQLFMVMDCVGRRWITSVAVRGYLGFTLPQGNEGSHFQTTSP
jgi:hypothetical protein